jgi:hypothetical protein
MAKQEETAKPRPEASFRIGKLMKASIWKNEAKGKDGQTYDFKNIQLQKSWVSKVGTDGKNEYESKDISLSLDEAQKAILALQAAVNHCYVVKE